MCEAWAWPLGARLRHLDSMTAGVTPLGQTRRLFSSRPSQPETAGTTQAAGPRGRKPQARGGHGEEARTEVIESTARFIAKNQSLPTPWSPSASEQPPGVPEPPATATGSCPENAPEPLSPGPSLSRPAPGLPPATPARWAHETWGPDGVPSAQGCPAPAPPSGLPPVPRALGLGFPLGARWPLPVPKIHRPGQSQPRARLPRCCLCSGRFPSGSPTGPRASPDRPAPEAVCGLTQNPSPPITTTLCTAACSRPPPSAGRRASP